MDSNIWLKEKWVPGEVIFFGVVFSSVFLTPFCATKKESRLASVEGGERVDNDGILDIITT